MLIRNLASSNEVTPVLEVTHVLEVALVPEEIHVPVVKLVDVVEVHQEAELESQVCPNIQGSKRENSTLVSLQLEDKPKCHPAMPLITI